MIKETVDAVRVAELEAEQVISTAEENAQAKKNQIKSEAQEYRDNVIKQAEENANQAMNSTVDKCNDYENQTGAEIAKKVTALKSQAESRMEKAVDIVINALV